MLVFGIMSCYCDLHLARTLALKYPDVLVGFTLQEIADVWGSFSEQDCAGWLNDDRETVKQVFHQALEFLHQDKPERFYWKVGRFFPGYDTN